MDQIRFSPPENYTLNSTQNNVIPKDFPIVPGNSKLKKILWKCLKVFGLVVVVLLVIYLAIFLKSVLVKNGDGGRQFYAVFLSNGQVYFGQLKDRDKEEFIIENVYYLQLSGDQGSAQTQLSEPKFSLIKLGNELHGPTDEMYINMSNVLFYEILRDDSKVVESIKNKSGNI